MPSQPSIRRLPLYSLALAASFAAGVLLRARGLSLSLWQDGAWVANSVLEPTAREMFFYDAWLQTSPPLFLLLVRWTVALLGPANWTLKLVPFLSGCAALAAMLLLVHRVFPKRRVLAVFLGVLAALAPLACYFSHVLKQYSGELLASTVLLLVLLAYIERPSTQRFALLLVTLGVGLTLAYGLALFVPAALVATSPWFLRAWRGRESTTNSGSLLRWLALGITAAIIIAAEHRFLVVPNSNPLLDDFWRTPIDGGFLLWATHAYSSVFVLLTHLPLPTPAIQFTGARIFAAVSLLVIGPALILRTRRRGWHRGPAELAAVLSLITVCAAIVLGLLRIYPLAIRTGLLYLPCVLILVGYAVSLIEDEYLSRLDAKADTSVRLAFWGLLFALTAVGISNRWGRPIAEEIDTAVSHLRDNAAPEDRIYVHASAVEGFKLYSRILDWNPPGVTLGRVAFPCCPRIDGPPQPPTEALLRADLLDSAPPPSRLWVLHANHPDIDWKSPGHDYAQLTGQILTDAGCQEQPPAHFRNMAVRHFTCPKP